MTEIARPQSKLGEKLSETRDKIVDMGHLASETAQEKYNEFKDRASEKYEDGKEKLQDLEPTFDQKGRASPVKSVLSEAGLGMVVGYLWRRS